MAASPAPQQRPHHLQQVQSPPGGLRSPGTPKPYTLTPNFATLKSHPARPVRVLCKGPLQKQTQSCTLLLTL